MLKTYLNREVQKFSVHSKNWWNASGSMETLHKFNPIRLEYIESHIKKLGIKIKDINIIDIGCGAGLVSENLAKKGYKTIGIDPSLSNIEAAKIHSEAENVDNIFYQHQDEFWEKNTTKFDVILALEVIEHVSNVEAFLDQITSIASEKSIVIISTINRNLKSAILAKYMAEYVIKLVPKGTHDCNKFQKPSEINKKMEKNNFQCIDIQGISFNPFTKTFAYSKNLDINYFMCFEKC